MSRRRNEAWYQRQRVWKHNSFLGHAWMMDRNLSAIIDADSTTQEAKNLANEMLYAVEELKRALKTRVDP